MAIAPAPTLTPLRNGKARTTIRKKAISQRTCSDPVEFRLGDVRLYNSDVLTLYQSWERPTVIIVDGPYGIRGFPGDPPTADGLCEWYEAHVRAWSRLSLPSTTLWFWGTELSWATIHPLLTDDWEFRNCHIWNKGKGHVAGNANTKTLRKFPVVTEVCVQYTKRFRFVTPDLDQPLEMKQWLRHEWVRSGLPLSLTNKACGVLNAATRKYFTQCHLWYFPPADAFQKFVDYANAHGDPKGRPYFSLDGKRPLTGAEWEAMRAKFNCIFGVNNVWTEPPVRGDERLKNGLAPLHANQKPLSLIRLTVESSSDVGDVVWEPFGGMCTVAVACLELRRQCFSAEVIPEFFEIAKARLAYEFKKQGHQETGKQPADNGKA
jgi:site-specific DNA-methyltransferase (adenine-specific)